LAPTGAQRIREATAKKKEKNKKRRFGAGLLGDVRGGVFGVLLGWFGLFVLGLFCSSH